MAAFNPHEHLMDIKTGQTSQKYLPVQWRLVWFREQCPHGSIETEMVHLDLDATFQEEGYAWNPEKRKSEKVMKVGAGIAIFKATARDGEGGVATGFKSEKAVSFPDFIEKAETGAIGRALAGLGYGTQFAPELDEHHRRVDTPVTTKDDAHQNHSPMVEQQRKCIQQLCQRLNIALPDDIATASFEEAAKMIKTLQASLQRV